MQPMRAHILIQARVMQDWFNREYHLLVTRVHQETWYVCMGGRRSSVMWGSILCEIYFFFNNNISNYTVCCFGIFTMVFLIFLCCNNSIVVHLWYGQGNLRGEPVVVAILWSHMEQSYCTSEFFRIKACQASMNCLSHVDICIMVIAGWIMR